MSLSLFALALCSFSIGMTEFVVIGILPILSADFQISIASAGSLVTLYALSVVFGAPLGAAFTAYMPRKTLLLLLMVLFGFGNFLSATASDLRMLILGRIFAGIAHGIFFAVGTNIAVQLVPKEKQGSAIALMFSGITIALVAGVPLGTFLASFSWRVTFFVVVAAAILAFFAILFFVPIGIHHVRPKSIFGQFDVFMHKKPLIAYAMTVLSFGSPFVAYTFLAAILQQITGFASYWIAPLLLVYGVAVALGNIWGGKLTDAKGPLPTLKGCSLSVVAILILFYFGQTDKWAVIPLLFLWGAASYAVCAPLQLLVVSIVKHYKLQAADVAAGVNIAAFNLGVTGASYLGSLVVDRAGLAATSWVAAVLMGVAFLFIWFFGKAVAHIKL